MLAPADLSNSYQYQRKRYNPIAYQVFGAELVFANIQSALKNPDLQEADLTGKLVQADIAAGIPFKRDSTN